MDAMQDLRGLIVILIIIFLVWLFLRDPGENVGGPFIEPPPPISTGETYGPGESGVRTPAGWSRIPFEHFSVAVPPGWNYRTLKSNYDEAGELRSRQTVLTFEYGTAVPPPITEHTPGHTFDRIRINGVRASLITPDDETGITGVYFPLVYENKQLSFSGFNLSLSDQSIAQDIFRTIQFSQKTPVE